MSVRDDPRSGAGVEAVLMDGTIVRRMSGLAKDNTGFDLAGLLTGSEGTWVSSPRSG